MSGAVSFVLGLLGLGTAAGIDLGQSVLARSEKRLKWLESVAGMPKEKEQRCMSGFVKSGTVFLMAIQIALKNGGSTIHVIRGLPIEQSIGSKIIWTQREFLMTI